LLPADVHATGRVERLCSKDNGAGAWTPATRSAMAVLGSHGVETIWHLCGLSAALSAVNAQ
jgi:hypothetical protein